MIISRTFLRFFTFVSSCFFIGYLISVLLPNFFVGTDKVYYLLLLQKNLDLSKLANYRNFNEPLFFLVSRIFSLIDSPKFSLEVLKLISLLIKSIFFSLLLFRFKSKYIFSFIGILIYFISFYHRSEIGSLRNCYATNILQFIIFFNLTFRSYLLVFLMGLFHFASAISVFPYLIVLNYKSISVQSPINQLKNFFKISYRFKIPYSIKYKFIYILSILVFGFVLLIFYRPNYFGLINLLSLSSQFGLRALSPFTYYRFYIHLFTLLGLILVYLFENKNRSYNLKFVPNIENNLYLILVFTLIILIGSLLPILTLVQRTSYISMYLCFVLSLYYLTKYIDNLYIFKKKIIFSILPLLMALLLIAGSSYKYFDPNSLYNQKLNNQGEFYNE